MNRNLKILLMFLFIVTVYALTINFTVIAASFDENKYVEDEVFTPTNYEFDFRLFSLNSSQVNNYTSKIVSSGYCQHIDDSTNRTINVSEWRKMSAFQKDNVNACYEGEMKKPHHFRDEVKVLDVDFLSFRMYAAYIAKDDVLVYVATPSEDDTVEMIKSLDWR